MSVDYLKGLQEIELEILLEVDRICQKHNIKYFLVSGTLLGAIRHKGFIPWDDDIDICMPLRDYQKFCEVCKNELDSKYFLQNYETDLTNMLFAKVRKNGTAAVQVGRENAAYHHGIWLDIFPLVGIKNNSKWVKKVKRRVRFAKKLLKIKIDYLEEDNSLPFYKKVHKLFPLNLIRLFVKLIYKTIFHNHEEYEHCYYLWAENNIRARFNSDLFSDIVYVEFEGHMLPAPEKWDKYLKIVYGDYMKLPPLEKRRGVCHELSYIDLGKKEVL